MGTCALAQNSTGRILGTVTDQSGAALNGATITVTDLARGTARILTTDGAGEYTAPDLIPGAYKVRAEAKGFKSVDRPNIEIEVAKDARIDFSLQTGDIAETVTVTDEVPLVEATNDVLGGTLSNKQINDLPLNGRDFQNLVVLQPGVMRYPGGGYETTSSNGVRPEDNNYIVDGIDNNEPFGAQSVINGTGTGGDSATVLPIDAIQQFNVEENPPAEYGWKPGAIVNVGLKSGTNQLHGTAYDFERNSVFDARNYFDTKPNAQTPLRLHQFGATVGGPIIRDKLFFFAGYEGVRYLVGNSNLVTSPATVSLGGDSANSVPDAIAALQAQNVAISPLSLSVSGCTLGPPVTCSGKLLPLNNGTNPAGPNQVISGFPNTARGDNGLAKIDYHISQKHTLTGMYFIGDDLETLQDAPVLQSIWESVGATRAEVLGGSWIWTPGSRWVNEARVGFNHFRYSSLTADNNVNPTAYGINTGVTNPRDFGMPAILINGFLQEGGNVGWPRYQTPDQSLQFLDNVSLTRGKHAIKFGGEARRGWATSIKDRYGKGRIQFKKNGGLGYTPLESFFAGIPAAGRIFVGNSERHPSAEWYSAFAQDDWRVTPRLTLNYGLRYELPTVIKEQDNLFGNFIPGVGIEQVGKGIDAPYAGNHKNFAPRLGLAWDVTGNGKTVVRAGAGIIYEMIGFNAFLAQQGVNNASTSGINVVPTASSTGVSPGGGNIVAGAVNLGGSSLNWTPAGPVFPTSSNTLNCNPNVSTMIGGQLTPGTPCDILAVNQHLKTPYVSSWNLNIQHSFTNNLVLQVGYVGNEGTKLLSLYDINQNVPALDTLGDEQSGRPYNSQFPFLHVINYLSNSYTSNYNGLQSTLTMRTSHGLSFVAGYTYAHALDYLSDNRGINAENAYDLRNEYGSSDFDIRHRFTFTTSYVVPGKKSWGQMLEGWQLNSILTLQSGQPWNVMDTGDDISLTGESSDRWDFFGNPADFTSSSIPIQYYSGTSNPACVAKATSPGLLASLGNFGCYAKGNSVMLPPIAGTFGTMHRNMFRDAGFRNWDLSVSKNWKFGERFTTQFRGEFFNVLNHPNFANPAGANVAYGFNDPSAGNFGCGCATPDVAAANPVVGSGGPRAIQLGLKLLF
ncbi:MAG TPA: TonB-dependent receptor [Terriglobales bacterium]|nr:TonB-dependent receptor [Terriglobales bacterium]